MLYYLFVNMYAVSYYYDLIIFNQMFYYMIGFNIYIWVGVIPRIRTWVQALKFRTLPS